MNISDEKRKLFCTMLEVFEKYRFPTIKKIVQNEKDITEKELLDFKHMVNTFIFDLDTVKQLIIVEYNKEK